MYTAAFALSVVVLGAIILLTTHATLKRAVRRPHQRRGCRPAPSKFRTEGLSGVVQAVQERDRTPGALTTASKDPTARPWPDGSPGLHAPLGWSDAAARRNVAAGNSIRILTTVLPQGYRLSVGDDDDQSEAVQATVLQGFGWAFAGVVVLGIRAAMAWAKACTAGWPP